ncbi:MAG: hypothetical protein D6743_18695 [Calditrichaeota bacterium]|nr:MAG: hypothetical protein D6743_18695 [Calditrichota bacterium]
MKKTSLAICILIPILFCSQVNAQPYLFQEPRHGGFKFLKHDPFDATHPMHFAGSGMLAVGLYRLLKPLNMNHPKVMAALLASGLGLAKEFEDAYREGWGLKDTIFDELGIVTFLLLSEQTRYSVTVENLVVGGHLFGPGLRFFKSNDITPLKFSFGFFAFYDNEQRTWVGVDTHFLLVSRLEVHLGTTLAKVQRAGRFDIRPSLGFAFRLL